MQANELTAKFIELCEARFGPQRCIELDEKGRCALCHGVADFGFQTPNNETAPLCASCISALEVDACHRRLLHWFNLRVECGSTIRTILTNSTNTEISNMLLMSSDKFPAPTVDKQQRRMYEAMLGMPLVGRKNKE